MFVANQSKKVMGFRRLIFFVNLLLFYQSFGQTLSLKEAVETGISNYGTIKAKSKYKAAADENVKQTQRDYLPNLTLSLQQDYGTVNGQNGPLYGFGGFGVASSGLPLPQQNWNAGFGALYLTNVNWEFFTFGKIKQRINLSKADVNRYEKDLEQEKFQHKIRIAAAYLNLLASQRMVISQQKNLERANVFYQMTAQKAKNGLSAGTDSTLAMADVSKAKILLNQIKDQTKELNNKLVFLMGIETRELVLDTAFIKKMPKYLAPASSTNSDTTNPILQFYKSRINFGKTQLKSSQTEYYPSLNFVGIYQTRGSGFNPDYAVNQKSFTRNYFDGINPSRQNYLLGIGLNWNLTSIARVNKKVSAQKLVIEALQNEYEVVEQQLKTQSDAAETKIKFAVDNAQEAPKQVAAAQQAYKQKTALYKNGLADLVAVTQTFYTLNRAEIDQDIILTNIWQSLLLKAAATGDFDLFMNEF